MPSTLRPSLFLATILVVASGCSSSTDDSAPNGAGGQGVGGMNDGGGNVGGEGGTAATSNADDHAALDMCTGTTSCSEPFAQRVEGGAMFTMVGFQCVLEALRDRTPGKYETTFDHSFSNGADEWQITFVITDSGAVEWAEVALEALGEDPPASTFNPTRRCMPKPASFFEDCLSVYADDTTDGAAWACVFPSVDERAPWVEACEEASPTCQ